MVDERMGEVVKLARSAVQAAFRHHRTSGQSSIAYFAGQARPKREKVQHGLAYTKCACDCDRCREKGVHTVQSCSCATHERRLRREMGFDEHHATATRPPGYSRPVLANNQDLAGATHRAIAELDGVAQEWIHYRYRTPGIARVDHGRRFAKLFFAMYEVQHLASCKPATRRTVRHLLSVAMENDINPHMRIKPDGGDISGQAWRKTYRPHWQRLCQDLRQIDRDSLYKVGKALIL